MRKWKGIELPHPAAVLAAAGVLLFGAHLNQMVRSVPQARVASFPPQSLNLPVVAALPSTPGVLQPERLRSLTPGEQPSSASGHAIGPAIPGGAGEGGVAAPGELGIGPFPGSRGPADLRRGSITGFQAAPQLPRAPAALPGALVGPPAPVRGPEWRGAPLPAFSPEVLRAMLDPRAVRRARRLRRRGIPMPAEPEPAPVSSADLPHPAGAASGGGKAMKTARAGAAPEAGTPRPRGSSPGTGSEPARPALTQVSRLERPELPGAGSPAAAVAAPREPGVQNSGPAATSGEPGGEARGAATGGEPGAAPASAKPTGETGTGSAATKPDGERPAPETATAHPRPQPAGRPIRLQARLDRPRPEYRAGEWVALRFFASQPAHLRVYRIDAAGHVTRIFSTYGRDDSGHPARTFSMMVRAGEPKPGQERVVAIGSARPLTRDELLACLRDYLAEGPAENPAPPAAPAAAPDSDMPPLADALHAVIDAVGRTADLPEAAPAPLERSSWSVAVGRFVSTANKLSAAG